MNSTKRITPILLALFLTGCMTSSQLRIDRETLPLPQQWQEQKALAINPQMAILAGHLFTPQLRQIIDQALDNNHGLKQSDMALAIAEKNVEVAGANVWPSLDLNLSSNRRKNVEPTAYVTSHDLSLQLRYELDVWGKLSSAERQANYNLNVARYQHQQQVNQLIVEVITAYYALIEADLQLTLFEKRAANTQENLNIIEAGYEQGLNGALDVYLTRNDLATEQARVAQQVQQVKSARRAIELLLGEYPAGTLHSETPDLPVLAEVWLPANASSVVASQPQLLASWSSLLVKDANLAIAHKQRFPSFTLSASTGTSSADLKDLIDSSSLSWSLLGGITQPLFYAGQLKASEQKAELELRQAEQGYLESLLQTFNGIEQNLANFTSVQTQLAANVTAKENALTAEELSFEQYQSGLVSYATVLAAQSRAFNAQSAVIQLRYQLINNQMNLLLLLGGDLTNLIQQETL